MEIAATAKFDIAMIMARGAFEDSWGDLNIWEAAGSVRQEVYLDAAQVHLRALDKSELCVVAKSELTRLRALLKEAEGVLEPFVKEFDERRDSYANRHKDRALGYANFDKMPDQWEMEKLTFKMGDFRAARSFLTRIRNGEG